MWSPYILLWYRRPQRLQKCASKWYLFHYFLKYFPCRPNMVRARREGGKMGWGEWVDGREVKSKYTAFFFPFFFLNRNTTYVKKKEKKEREKRKRKKKEKKRKRKKKEKKKREKIFYLSSSFVFKSWFALSNDDLACWSFEFRCLFSVIVWLRYSAMSSLVAWTS